MKIPFHSAIGTLSFILVLPVFAQPAQVYPTKPIRVVVALPPGGSIDLTARIVSERLQAGLGRPAVVDNRPGAGGSIATEIVARSAPDGHTLLVTSAAHAINPSFHPKLPYDPIADFAPVALMTAVHFALVVHPSLPAATVKEFIAVAKAKPGAITYASAGNGQSQHLAMELLKSMARVDLAHVPYKGAGQFVPALVSGEVVSVIGAINSLLPHVQTGKLRLLAMAGNRRAPLLPDVPTIAEAALPGFALDSWCGLLVPAGTARPVIDRLHAEIAKALSDPQVTGKLAPQGIEVITSTPEEFQARIKADLVKWAKVVKDAKIKPE
jgi:tripartite-type tricarboxylate transporter receptor subunit TctC